MGYNEWPRQRQSEWQRVHEQVGVGRRRAKKLARALGWRWDYAAGCMNLEMVNAAATRIAVVLAEPELSRDWPDTLATPYRASDAARAVAWWSDLGEDQRLEGETPAQLFVENLQTLTMMSLLGS